MDPITLISLASGAMSMVETLIPAIQKLAQSGEITKEQQQAVLEKYNALVSSGDAMFEGPEWQVE